MKIRKHRVKEYYYHPSKNSKLNKGICYRFKYKNSLMKFLNNNIEGAVNGYVSLYE
jgi:hypothetical protein